MSYFVEEAKVDYNEICPGMPWAAHDESVRMFNNHMGYNTNTREIFVEENN